jgi:hypothetical protein
MRTFGIRSSWQQCLSPPTLPRLFAVKSKSKNGSESMSLFLRQILALLFAAVIVASASFPSDAAPAARKRTANFDGLWSVAIVTLQGSCDRSYRYPVRIVGSRVMQAGADPSYRLYGAVSRNGTIRVIVVRGGQWADGRGRLTDGRGGGNWTTSTGQCSGQWTAARRGD